MEKTERLSVPTEMLNGHQPKQKPEYFDPYVLSPVTGKPMLRIESGQDIRNKPDVDHLIEDLLLEATVSMHYGETGLGKTFFLLHLALCIATGTQFFGHDVKQGRVLYIYAEGWTGIKPRYIAWCKQLYNGADPSNMFFHPMPVHLITNKQHILETLQGYGEPFTLLVIDTWAACATGVPRTEPTAVKQSLDVALEAAMQHNCHVAVGHNTNALGESGGARAFVDNSFTVIKLHQLPGKKAITVHCDKQRDIDKFADFNIEMVPGVVVGFNQKRNKDITSCYLQASTEPTLPQAKQQQKMTNQELARDILLQEGELNTKTYIQKCKEQGMSVHVFYAVTIELKEQGMIDIWKTGKGSEVKYAYVETDQEQMEREQKEQQIVEIIEEEFSSENTSLQFNPE